VSSLSRHRIVEHSPRAEWPHQREDCKIGFPTPGRLRDHNRLYHPDVPELVPPKTTIAPRRRGSKKPRVAYRQDVHSYDDGISDYEDINEDPSEVDEDDEFSDTRAHILSNGKGEKGQDSSDDYKSLLNTTLKRRRTSRRLPSRSKKEESQDPADDEQPVINLTLNREMHNGLASNSEEKKNTSNDPSANRKKIGFVPRPVGPQKRCHRCKVQYSLRNSELHAAPAACEALRKQREEKQKNIRYCSHCKQDFLMEHAHRHETEASCEAWTHHQKRQSLAKEKGEPFKKRIFGSAHIARNSFHRMIKTCMLLQLLAKPGENWRKRNGQQSWRTIQGWLRNPRK
jgi:hypothetical protein